MNKGARFVNIQALSVLSTENTRALLQVFHGASRTRTGDLLGAIQSPTWGRTG